MPRMTPQKTSRVFIGSESYIIIIIIIIINHLQ